MEVSFRRLTDEDLPVLHRWLDEPGVQRWWEGDDISWEAVERQYGAVSTDPVERSIATVGGRGVGWILCDAAADGSGEAEPWWTLGVEMTTDGPAT